MSEANTRVLASTVTQNEGVFAAEIGREELAILNIERGRYYMLNVTARAVWQRLEMPTRVTEVCRSLQEDFQVEPLVCEHDTVALVTALLGEGLVRVVAPEA